MTSSNYHLHHIDLNLLVALQALIEEGGVTRAAKRLHVTQSAMSQTLRRLRELFDDELLVRHAGRMAKTNLAHELATPLARALAELRAVVERRPTFDPSSARRRFVVATTDYVGAVVLPEFLAIMRNEAPAIDIDVRSLDIARYARALEAGEIDLVMSPLDPQPDVVSEVLFRDDYACLVRKGHPLLRQRKNPRALAVYPHIMMSPRGQGQGIVDDALEKIGISRRVAVRVPMFAIGASMIAATDMVMTAPQRLASIYARAFGLSMFLAPLELPELAPSQAWHVRDDANAASRWLRETMRRACDQTARS